MSRHLFIVGAQRAGTTYLYHLLNEHPMIEMAEPVRPEPKFFLQPLDGLTKRDYLMKHFPGRTHAPVLGEKSTSYIESDEAAMRIAGWYPEAKILMILREPIARAISNYLFSTDNRLETLSFEQAIREEEGRRDNYDRSRYSTSPYAYLGRGRYVESIQRWLNYFPRERVLVLIHEEVVGSLERVQQLYEDLEVDASHRPRTLNKVMNASEKEKGMPRLSPETQQYLRDYFAESNAALETLLGRAIPAWK